MIIALNPKTVIGDCLETAFGIKTYCYLVECASKDNFAATADYRKAYNGFYKVRSRTPQWYDLYYSLLEEQKDNPRSFAELLRKLHKYDGNLEVSFASKLIATIDTSKPIWDQYVVANLDLKKEWEQARKLALEERTQLADSIYSKIQLCYQETIHSPEGQQCIDRFDRELPKYKNIISDTKKIDFFLWSKRQY